MNAAGWDKNEIVSQGRRGYENGTSFDANPYKAVPLSRGGLFKAAYWDSGWRLAEFEDGNAIADED